MPGSGGRAARRVGEGPRYECVVRCDVWTGWMYTTHAVWRPDRPGAMVCANFFARNPIGDVVMAMTLVQKRVYFGMDPLQLRDMNRTVLAV